MDVNAAKTAVHGTFQNLVNAVKPIPTVSTFLQEGDLTPDEFVKAGDLLVAKCPTWSWQPGDPSKAVSYLPKEKQFLITRNVPCNERIKAMQGKKLQNTEVKVEGLDEGAWVLATQVEKGDQDAVEIKSTPAAAAPTSADDDDDDDGPVPDMDDFKVADNLVKADQATLSTEDNVLMTRTYDISITYDLYYKTPKVWLYGYDESHAPLQPDKVFQDISQDHAKKTVTIEAHPHLGYQCAFIHPCKHAAVMKKIIARVMENGRTPRVDQYLFLFLKFISAVIPTIEYDFTVEMEA